MGVAAALVLLVVAVGVMVTDDDGGDDVAVVTQPSVPTDPVVPTVPGETPSLPSLPIDPSDPGTDPGSLARPLEDVLPEIIEFVEVTRGHDFVTEPVVEAVPEEEIFQILVASDRTRSKMLSCLTDTIIHSTQSAEALERIEALASVPNVPIDQLERLRAAMGASTVLSLGKPRVELLALLAKYKLKPLAARGELAEIDDNIPF